MLSTCVIVPSTSVGTIDVLLAQLCLRYDLTMLSIDRDFERVARHAPLRLWRGAP